MESRIAIVTPKNFPTASVDQKRGVPFVPTMDQVREIERKLSPYLEAHHPALFRKFTKYYRQYEGIQIAGGQKKVRCNFLCRVPGDRWKKEWITVRDGGECYFGFSYDLDKREISEFYVNGEA